ncbi:MAG: S41 family peptidase [Defluviitaleaceae bacterium]|nr:S41 family peptidase [Defluviitaleaceae bacterium]
MNKKNFLEGMVVGIVLIMALNMLIYFVLPAMSFSPLNTTAGFDISSRDKLNRIYRIIDTHFVDDFDRSELQRGMFMGLMYGLGDIYSTYMSIEEFTAFNEQTEGIYPGIGAIVTNTEDGRVMVVAPFDGTPAYQAGIMAQDVIFAVDGVDTRNLGLEMIVSMMRGEAGTAVILTIFRESEGRTFDVEIIRDHITMQTVTYRMLTDDIGYIRLSGFERVTYIQFVEALQSLKNQGADGFIFDVRNNPGGLLDVVGDITNLLVPEGNIVFTEDRRGHQRFLRSDADYLNIPLVLLVNGNSASASEVMAGAIRDYGVGVIVGEQTFGKGLVQNVFPLDDGSAVKLTVARYYSPKGISIHGEGITPDYVVPMEPELSARITALTIEEDIQLLKAVDVMEGMLMQGVPGVARVSP